MSPHTWSRDQLVAATEDAAEFYRRQLLGPSGEGPRRYLAGRGFQALLDDSPWTVGYAPATWTALHDHLAELGYSNDCQLAAGLVTVSRSGHSIDRFRDRITFGVHDTDQALVGFVARSSPGAPTSAPRYLNTPATAIYNKCHLLFGAGEQANRLRQGATPVLVEGALDAIAIELASTSADSAYAGLALSGTAFSNQHVDKALVGAPTKAILMFDPDPAGQSALRNAYSRLADQVGDLQAVGLPPDTDPAELLHREGPTALLRRLEQATDAADLIVDAQLASWPAAQTGAEADVERLREVASLIIDLGVPNVARQAARIRGRLPFNDEVVTRELAEGVNRSRQLRPAAQRRHQLPSRTFTRREARAP